MSLSSQLSAMAQEHTELTTAVGFGIFQDVYSLMFLGVLNGMEHKELGRSSYCGCRSVLIGVCNLYAHCTVGGRFRYGFQCLIHKFPPMF